MYNTIKDTNILCNDLSVSLKLGDGEGEDFLDEEQGLNWET